MLGLISGVWSWLPGPLSAACFAVCMTFFIMVLYRFLHLLVEFIKEIISVVKALLLRWGIGL